METIGASHSTAACRHCSSGTMSLSDVEYSRMRPQPVQVRLQVCSGSSCKTIANLGVLRSLCLMMWLAIFFVNANGKRIIYFKQATSTEASVNETGAFVVAGAGSAFKKLPIPGKKKSSGETVFDALMPPQPASSNEMAGSMAKGKIFQLILTCRV